jgi:hypothetical protein
MARGLYDTSMIHCYLTDCFCSANYKNAARQTEPVSPKAKELHPKKLPAFKRENATLSDDKENYPPNQTKDDQHDEPKKT